MTFAILTRNAYLSRHGLAGLGIAQAPGPSRPPRFPGAGLGITRAPGPPRSPNRPPGGVIVRPPLVQRPQRRPEGPIARPY